MEHTKNLIVAPKILSDPKSLWTQNSFQTQHFFSDQNFFWTQHFFWTQIFFWNSFLDKNFVKPFQAKHFRLESCFSYNDFQKVFSQKFWKKFMGYLKVWRLKKRPPQHLLQPQYLLQNPVDVCKKTRYTCLRFQI